MAQPTSKWSGYLLGLVPVGVGVVFGVLCLPRVVPPEDVPVPVADASVLAHIAAHERALASEPAPLPDDVRALGSAIREFNAGEAKQGVDPYMTPAEMNHLRTVLDQRSVTLLDGRHDEVLLALRATQLESFVREVRAFERSGAESSELVALGGPFVRRMREVGWCRGDAAKSPSKPEPSPCTFDDDALRVMFKLSWNGLLRLDRAPFAPVLDEERALYAFYLRHPHAPESARKRIDEARSGARTARACAALDEGEAQAAELWRTEKVKRLALIDPAYPRDYALGVLDYRRKEYEAAAESFRDWLDAHPDGAWTLRARNYLRASLHESALER